MQVLYSVNSKHIRRLLRDHYHKRGPGRKPFNPLSILKAQLLKHLHRIPSDRRLALRLKHYTRKARACGFNKQTPSHDLFTHFRKRLGEETYHRIFHNILRRLLEDGGVKGDVVAVDSTHVDAYSQRAPDNRTGRSRLRSPRRQRPPVRDRPATIHLD
jgi:transposase